MNHSEITHCPGTLVPDHDTYSRTCLARVFDSKKVSHVLPFDSPSTDPDTDKLFEQNMQGISISGVQEKFSLILHKNKLRLIQAGEQGTHILKPIPNTGRRIDQMPPNEHLTMQIARQVYAIETAENALIFFRDGEHAYLTKRFDVHKDGSKRAQDDFASLSGRTPQTHGKNYKYLGNYLQLFEVMKKFVPAYTVEAPKLLKLIMFNYLFANGDAHFKNFSLLETDMGDYRLSPAYDLLNSRIHISDRDFALDEGLLPEGIAKGKMRPQFALLAQLAGIKKTVFEKTLEALLSKSPLVEQLTFSSFLDEKTKRNYWQSYLGRLKQLHKQ